MTAPLSPAQAGHLARVEAAPESLRTTVLELLAAYDKASIHGDPYATNRLTSGLRAAVTTPAPDAPAGWSAEVEWQCPSCGATTRARMSDRAAPAAVADTQDGGR